MQISFIIFLIVLAHCSLNGIARGRDDLHINLQLGCAALLQILNALPHLVGCLCSSRGAALLGQNEFPIAKR